MSAATRAGGFALAVIACACATAPAREAPANAGPRNAGEAYADFLVGRLANSNAEHAVAARRYAAALAHRPADPGLTEAGIAAALAAGEGELARAMARTASLRRVESANARLVRAADALAGARYGQARGELARIENNAPSQLVAQLMLAWADAGAGEADQALNEISPLLALHPYAALFQYQQAMALDFLGRNEEALRAYASAAQSHAYVPDAIEHHADLLARTGAREGAAALLSASGGRTGNPALAQALGRAQAGAAIASAPISPANGAALGLYSLASAFVQDGDPADGLAALTLALMLDPSFEPARLSFAEAQSRQGQTGAALSALRAVSPQSPYASSARVMEAWALFGDGRREEALALVSGAEEARAQRARADMLRSMERWGEAEPIYTALIGADPQDWRLFFARGAARERLGAWPAAEADLRQALELSPDQPEVLNYLGYSWADRGEHLGEALAMIQRAVRARPHSGGVIDSLGWAYFRLARYNDAVDTLEHALELEPADVTLNDHLGDAYWRSGRRIEARFQWRRALALEPPQADRAAIEAKLDRGLPALAAPPMSARTAAR